MQKENYLLRDSLPITSSPRWRGPPWGSPRTRPCAPATSTAWPARGSPAVPGAPGAAKRSKVGGLPRGAPMHGTTCRDDGAARGLLYQEDGNRPRRHMLPPGSSPVGAPGREEASTLSTPRLPPSHLATSYLSKEGATTRETGGCGGSCSSSGGGGG